MNRPFERVRQTLIRWDLTASPVRAGRLLLLVTGIVVTGSVSALGPSRDDWLSIGAISAAMFGLLLASFVLPWNRLHRGFAFVFPISVLVALASLSTFASTPIGSAYSGLFVLCFAYTGVFLPLHSGFPLAVVAIPAYVVEVARWDAYIQVRLSIAVVIWILLAEIMALLTNHQRQITDLLQQAASTDALTGVGSRRDLDARISSMHPGDTVVVCDLDHFKLVNDTYGHARGDTVLREFGAVLRGCLRGDDYAGRYGGEEFVLILADTDESEAQKVMHRLRRKWLTTGLDVTYSAGFRGVSAQTTPQHCLADADAALYLAKSSGRDRTIRFSAITDPLPTAPPPATALHAASVVS